MPETGVVAAETDRGRVTVVPAAVPSPNSPAAAPASVFPQIEAPPEGRPRPFQPLAVVAFALAFGLAWWAFGLAAALALTLSAAATVLLADAARSLRKVAAAASRLPSDPKSGR